MGYSVTGCLFASMIFERKAFADLNSGADQLRCSLRRQKAIPTIQRITK